jgi:hypothetical protein
VSVRIYPPEAGELNPNYWIDARFIYKNLERFFEEARVCGLFKDANDANGIAINLLAVEPNGLVLKAIPADDGARPSLMHRYTLVTFVDGGKVQFEINKLRATQEGSYIADLPKAMAVIQRRKGFDISEDGLQLDLRLNATEMSVGTIWSGCSFERLKVRSEPFDLVIRNTRPSAESSRIRVGCQLVNPTQLNRNQFESTRNAIHSARIQRRLKFWFQNVSWYS